ncbi:MAG: beta-N-acetylhexosaminidase [Candidatus Midichloriaceae bacterium]|jgi:beta-N-acetylhexosaminidase|nr:beta-N-acetylhexosaminidase [Candidatus Midichloriaceae bacterium]
MSLGVKPLIFGISGTKLTKEEIEFFKEVNPYGYILFARNIETKDQVRELTRSLTALNPNRVTPILIDQEGGRVARLRPPLAKDYPTAKYFGDIAKQDLDAAYQEVLQNYYNIGLELKEFGINVDCAPVADLLFESAHEIIGDRSFGSSVSIVTKLCEAACVGLKKSGVKPILKHIPGHGRAQCDSHEDLPIITTDLLTLESTDFQVFKNLSSILDAWVMTAHIIFPVIDPDNCITTSKLGISYIRNRLGYKDTKILSDDLSMKALKKTVGENAIAALQAGCDIALHCNGKIDEMVDIYKSVCNLNTLQSSIIK